jgi:hypothetical protein
MVHFHWPDGRCFSQGIHDGNPMMSVRWPMPARTTAWEPPMTHHSILSFDHLQSTDHHPEHPRYKGALVEAQIRNGQMKYQRTTLAAEPLGVDLAMPDGEIMPAPR